MFCDDLICEDDIYYNSLSEVKRFIVEKNKLLNNIKIIKNKYKVPIYGVIKHDGYGVGLIFMAQALKECGVNTFGVSNVEDLVTLRKSGFEDEEIIMLFSTCIEEELEIIVKENAIATIGSLESARLIDNMASRESKKVRAHIQIDTGVGEDGFLYNDVVSILKVYKNFRNIEITGIYFYLNCNYCSVRRIKRHIKRFEVLLNKLRYEKISLGIVHMSNSSALFNHNNFCFNAIPVGEALVGEISSKFKYGLEKVGYLEGQVREIKWLPPNSYIGYGRKFKTTWSTKIAIIPIGTKDGFGVFYKYDSYRIRDCIKYIMSILKKCMFNRKTYIEINNKRVPILGQIGQNHVIVDITALGIEVGDKCKFNINPLYVNNNILKQYI